MNSSPLIQEPFSNWSSVAKLVQNQLPLSLGRYGAYIFHHTPRRMLYSLSYYKFAAKLIGPSQRVLDVGCNEGLGSWVLAKECGFCQGIDFDANAIETAQKNFPDPSIAFLHADFCTAPPSALFHAATSFDVIEHIAPDSVSIFWNSLCQSLTPEGMVIIGTPSLISQQFASPISKRGHINIYSHERLEEEMSRFFEYTFLFSANDEIVHTGYLPLAHYFIAVGCKKKQSGH